MFIFSDDIAKRVIGTAVTETMNALGEAFYRHCSQNEKIDETERIQEYLNELSNLLSESNKLKQTQKKQIKTEVNF